MNYLIPKFIRYQLYLLQLENYELGRYFKLLFKKGIFPRGQQRKELVWTAKARALMLMAGALHALLIIAAALIVMSLRPGLDNLATAVIISALILLPFYFVLFTLALLALTPADIYVKNQLVKKARGKIEKLKGRKGVDGDKGRLMVIGVAGSYGKTTMKEVLHSVLSTQFSVLSTPESVNTPVGIARFILNKVTDNTQVLILEMGEHYRGDIKQLCEIAKPEISVITGINEAHLERMKTLDNIIATIFEAAEYAKPGAAVVLNGNDKNVTDNYRKFTTGHQVVFYSSGKGLSNYAVVNKKFDTQELSWKFKVEGKEEFVLPLLGEYAVGAGVAALAVGEQLGLSTTDIKVGLSQVRPVEHRLQPIKSAGDVLVIDDSYNGNPDGVCEAIKALSKFNGRRKIYITPGLVEMGPASADIHREIGKQLAGTADVVMLVENSATPFIEQGLRQQAIGNKAEIIWFNTAQDAHQGLKNIIKPGDVVMFQNDWGDQYL